MNISYGKLTNEIFKILKGLGFSVQLFDTDGSLTSSTDIAKYIWAKPDGIMFEMPDDSSEIKEIVINKPESLDINVFKNIYNRVKNIAKIHGIEVSVGSFEQNITPKDFSYKVKAKKEEELASMKESIKFPHLNSYFKNN